MFDLLTDREARNQGNVFDIDLLGERVVQAVDWAQKYGATAGMSIGLFGASTGAAAALVAAASRSGRILAVVSRGGRPDLAGTYLQHVQAPTLLIVGGADDAVIGLNEAALVRLQCKKRLVLVPGATHLFEEPATLDLVVDLDGQWFDDHMSSRPYSTAGR